MTQQPDYCQEGVTLYRGECERVLPILQPDFDALVTDPPFGIGFKYSQHDDSQTPDEYGAWLWQIIEKCERLLKPGSPVLVW